MRPLTPPTPTNTQMHTPHHIKAWFSWHLPSILNMRVTDFLLEVQHLTELNKKKVLLLVRVGLEIGFSVCCFFL